MKRKACIAVILAHIARKINKKKIKKRRWVKDWILQRQRFTHVNLLDYIKEAEPNDFKNYLRMNSETYQELLDMVTPYIEKKNTNMRQAISAHERLSVCLRFLATGRSFEDLKFSTSISPTTTSEIIMETCEAIICVLKDFIKVSKIWITNKSYFLLIQHIINVI